MSTSPAAQSFSDLLTARSLTAAAPADAMTAYRSRAMSRFMQLGVPTSRDESWRYTNLRTLAARRFKEPMRFDATNLAPLSGNFMPQVPGALVMRINNGIPDWSATPALTPGVQVSSLSELERDDPGLLESLLSALPEAERQRWSLLNGALFKDGLHIRLRGESAPMWIIHTGAAQTTDDAVHSRVIVTAEPGARATIIELHTSTLDHALLSNSVCSAALDVGARVEHFRIFASSTSTTHMDDLQVQIGRDARLLQHTVCLGGGLVRTNLEATLAAPRATLDSYCLLSGHDSQHLDAVNTVAHAAPHTTSRQTARVIASGRSRAIFNSKVIVEPGAQKADSRQSCRSLLLSPTAEVDTRPQLEIHADDVKCAHGASTGRLDPDMLFYMLARGLDRATAQSLLVFAFLADALTAMSVAPVRKAVESALILQLPDSQLLQNFQ